jgi:hypothetical protein
LSGSPFIQARTDDDGVDLVWGTVAGRVGMTHLPETAMPSESWVVEVGDSLSGGPVPLKWQGVDGRILCPVHPDQLVLVDREGNPVGEAVTLSYPGGIPVRIITVGTPFPGANDSDLVPVFGVFGWFLVKQIPGGLDASPSFHSYGIPFQSLRIVKPTWTAVVATGEEHQVHVVEGGAELGAWRVTADGTVTDLGLVLGVDVPLVSAPAVADVDGDGHDDLVLATVDRIHGLRPDGIALRGFPVRFYDLFPLPDSTRIAGPLVVADATGDGINEIYFNTDGGHLVGLDAVGRLIPQTPMRWADRRTGGLAIGGPDDGRVMWLVSPGGYTGPPLDRHFVNGRVSAMGLADARDANNRTSEWRGPAGGAYRRGSEGLAKNLGPASPAAAETDRVVLYPNPMVGDEVTVRFFSAGTRSARLSIYNLAGEQVTQVTIPVTEGSLNEYRVSLPGVASGLYLARLEYDAAGGFQSRTLTLAVEK